MHQEPNTPDNENFHVHALRTTFSYLMRHMVYLAQGNQVHEAPLSKKMNPQSALQTKNK